MIMHDDAHHDSRDYKKLSMSWQVQMCRRANIENGIFHFTWIIRVKPYRVECIPWLK